jgi:hypothetical protein
MSIAKRYRKRRRLMKLFRWAAKHGIMCQKYDDAVKKYIEKASRK